MFNLKNLLVLGLVLVTVGGGLSGMALAADPYGASAVKEDSAYTLDEMLTYAIQDEYLAYAEYSKIIGTFGNIRPFTNILKAEQTHITTLESLFTKLGIAKPENNAASYVTSPTSVKEALTTEIQTEKNNIAMYEKFLNQDLPDDVEAVFQALKNASENHLAAYERSLAGGTGAQAQNGNGRMGMNSQGNRARSNGTFAGVCPTK